MRGRDTISAKNPIAGTGAHSREKSHQWSFSCRSKGLMPHIRHPNPWNLYWRDEFPKMSDLENQWVDILWT